MTHAGYRGHDWPDMSEYAVHFTKANGSNSPYKVMLSILHAGVLRPGPQPFGAARRFADQFLADPDLPTQYSVCFSEIPLGQLDRLVERRESHYGIAFRHDFLARRGGSRVWYLDKGTQIARSFDSMMGEYVNEDGKVRDGEIWQLTPFVDFPGTYGGADYRFEWEREWRKPGELRFKPDDVAYLFLPAALHAKARRFFADAAAGPEPYGPDYPCPYLDPTWDADQVSEALYSGRNTS
ncbi:unannotated protein [freshwater metagenome]|uniref:Unannotated protein n=1 Tax=freshwater metagenome TaxID=449393 RepID=A0A6J7HSG7_9ZZZZ|nr:hypothetical protein [Actinomycetota bacterium]